MAMARGQARANWRKRTPKTRGTPKGTVSLLKLGYTLRISHRMVKLNRSKEAARRKYINEKWGIYACAADAKARAKYNSQALIRLNYTSINQQYMDNQRRARSRDISVLLGDGWQETHMDYVRFTKNGVPRGRKVDNTCPLLKRHGRDVEKVHLRGIKRPVLVNTWPAIW